MKVKNLMVLSLITAMVGTVTGCGSEVSQPAGSTGQAQTATADTGNKKVFILGSPQPLSGANAQAAETTLNGIKLAVKQLNEQGGFNGTEIRLVSYDDQGLPEEAVKIANKMVDIDKVDAVIGPLLSTCQMAQGELINRAGIPTVGIGLSPTYMAKDWDYVVRASLNSDITMEALAKEMVRLDITSIAIFSGQDDSSKSASGAMKVQAEANGIKVTTVETYVDGDTDFSGQVAKILNTNPEAVYVASYANVMPVFAKQLRLNGFEGLCFNKELVQSDSVSVAGDAANHWIFSYPYVSYLTPDEAEDEMMKAFLTAYVAEYGSTPTHEGAYRGYDAVMILNEGVKNANSFEGSQIIDGIKQIDGYEGLGGTFNYTDGSGEGLKECKSFIVSNQKYISLDAWLESGGLETMTN